MVQFQNSNLPERSVPWGREIEAAIKDANGDKEQLEQALSLAQKGLSSQAEQLQQLTDYIRILCQNMGNTFPPAYVPPVVPPAPDPADPTTPGGGGAQQFKTIEINAEWSATWYQSFKRTQNTEGYDDKRSLYQRGTGYTFSMFRFGAGEAAGKSIQSANLFLSNKSSFYNGPFTAVLGTHANVTEPAARVNRANGWDVGWTAGEAKWINIDPTLLPGISNGSIQGFTLGDLGRDNNNFARFNGVGRPGSPVLRLTYAV